MELLHLGRNQKSPQRENLKPSLSAIRAPVFHFVYPPSCLHHSCCKDIYLSAKFIAHLRLS